MHILFQSLETIAHESNGWNPMILLITRVMCKWQETDFFEKIFIFLLRNSRETHNSRWLILCTIWPVGSSWMKLTLTTGCSSFITEHQPFFAWQEQLSELRHNTLVTQSGRGFIKNAFDFDYDSTSSQSMWNRKDGKYQHFPCDSILFICFENMVWMFLFFVGYYLYSWKFLSFIIFW